ncbi:protein translocation complex, SEC61 gamma subunit [Toxoplasma gondii VAND]|uniref:Protein translocation complex, SEC61 gamma subunit n=1 Tax=Toxoplasma gondii VAND TaxID=933077 RepID=A0A086PS16_TOXGO|nr:protein translocation complex, SEC61 gamma subunit [Toxoplasma gondii VAND]
MTRERAQRLLCRLLDFFLGCAALSFVTSLLFASVSSWRRKLWSRSSVPQIVLLSVFSPVPLSSSTMVNLNKVPAFLTDPNHPIGSLLLGLREFFFDSVRLVRRCTKPDAREFRKIAYACAIGFLLMGFIGYFIKLIFIPINNILVGPPA